MKLDDELVSLADTDATPCCCIVRLRTSCWSDRQGLHIRKSLTILRRKSQGFNILEEDLSNIGATEFEQHITNLYELEDGIYDLVTCNEKRNWESGVVDDYDYRLIPVPKEVVP